MAEEKTKGIGTATDGAPAKTQFNSPSFPKAKPSSSNTASCLTKIMAKNSRSSMSR